MPPYIWERTGWTQLRWNNDKILVILGECRLLQGKLLSKVADLGFDLGSQAQVEILAEETMKTAAIEGESLDMKAVRSSVARRLGLPSGGLEWTGMWTASYPFFWMRPAIMINPSPKTDCMAGRRRCSLLGTRECTKSRWDNGGEPSLCAWFQAP